MLKRNVNLNIYPLLLYYSPNSYIQIEIRADIISTTRVKAHEDNPNDKVHISVVPIFNLGNMQWQVAEHRGSYMSAHVLLNLLNSLGKRDKMRGLPSILSLFHNEFNKFNNTRARMLDTIYHMTNTLKSHFWRKTL